MDESLKALIGMRVYEAFMKFGQTSEEMAEIRRMVRDSGHSMNIKFEMSVFIDRIVAIDPSSKAWSLEQMAGQDQFLLLAAKKAQQSGGE